MSAWLRRLPLAVIVCSLLGLVAISATTSTPSAGEPAPGQLSQGQPTGTPRPAATLLDPTPRMAIVYDVGGRGGGAGFNELVWTGAQRAADIFSAELTEITAESGDTAADREVLLEEVASASYGQIFVIGSAWAYAVAEVAPRYPETWFAVLDDGTVDAPNVIGITFNEEQGSFLAGAAAALTSTTGRIGFIGEVKSPLLQEYEAGFAAGARAVNPRVKVQVKYLSRQTDGTGPGNPAKARKAALRMYDAGADVVYAAAAESGIGVIQAAHDRGRWAIGFDSDQYLSSDPSLRSAVLTSMVKRADVATFTVAMEIGTGVPKDGNNVLGLDRDGVGYAVSGGFVDPIRAQLDAFATRIAGARSSSHEALTTDPGSSSYRDAAKDRSSSRWRRLRSWLAGRGAGPRCHA
jgi:basic membrane protein A